MTTTSCGALLAHGVQQLQAAAAGGHTHDADLDARLDAQLLLAHILGVTRARLVSHPEAPCGAQDAARYDELLGRRAAGEPLAYLVGHREFWSLDLAVGPAVLVPRPETELLVERALARGPATAGRVADLGTGSGAVALALASERPHWHVVATDISPAALAVARSNAVALGLAHVEFRLGDWYAALAGELFDMLVSNPPYVAAADPALLLLQHEPQLALTPGADALASLRTLAAGAAAHLVLGGWLLLEHGAGQGPQVRDALVLAGFRHVRSHRDLAGHERMTEGQR
jgi:release factor glutamine methyltransferase